MNNEGIFGDIRRGVQREVHPLNNASMLCVCDVCGLGGAGGRGVDGEWRYLKLLEMWILGWSLLLPGNVLLMQQSVQVWLRISLINSFI